jgi:glucose/arabinose dehydrogenase
MTRWILCIAALMVIRPGTADLLAQSPTFRAEVVAGGLVTPWSLAFAPDGRLFVAERSGRIRVIEQGQLIPAPWATVPAYDAPERSYETGLMGLAIDPRFPGQPFVYACYTHRAADSTLTNRVVRLAERNRRGGEERILVDRIPAAAYHNGCRLKFGPDGKLYATTGDAQVERLAQDPASLAGKILRLNPDGTIPADNPFPSSPVWSLGHRNAQGLAWQPGSSRLYVPEHGTGGIDELNLVERGGNYGWPVARGQAGDAHYADPMLVLVAAPTGAVFLTGSRYPDLPPDLLVMTSLSGQRVLLVVTGSPGTRVFADSALTGYGRLRDVVMGPDGYLYVSTSNRDGRGTPAQEDDRVLRLVPAGDR